MQKMILYIKDDCAASEFVVDEGEKLGFEFELRNIAEPAVADDLIERGGKKQTPYLVDVENAIEMYEAPAIVEYLQGLSGESVPLDMPDLMPEEEQD